MKLTPATDIVIAQDNTKPHDAIEDIIFLLMNAKIGRYGCHAVEKFIKSQESSELIRRTSRVHGEQSLVGDV